MGIFLMNKSLKIFENKDYKEVNYSFLILLRTINF